jgi:predicted nucleic acid-binding protein
VTASTSVVVDTMVVSALLHAGRDPGAAARYRSIIDGRTVLVSFVTVTEMRFGAIKAGWGEIRRRSLERVLDRLVVVQPDDDLMLTCAELRASCLAAAHAFGPEGPRGGPLIAATAMALGVDLISGDAVFEHVPGLVVHRPSM